MDLFVTALDTGLRTEEIESMDVGYLMDYLLVKANRSHEARKKQQDKNRPRKATQADFDRL